jgi:glycosyltransferase involved in cell wall biosynthesis
MSPKISIITPCFNRAEFIIEAVESVSTQSHQNFEHIIVDGKSTDGTMDILKDYSHLLTIVESDRGLYDAINKGLRMADGEIIGLLNSDDYYQKETFREVSTIFESDDQIDVVVGEADIFEATVSGNSLIDRFPSINENTLLDQLFFGAPAINAWFFRRNLFDRVGNFDLTYPVGADRDFLIKLYLNGFTRVFANKIYYHYRRHSGSLTINQGLDAQERILLENRRLAHKYLSMVNNQPILHEKIKKWHDLTSIELMILFARQRRLRDLADTIRIAIGFNWAWLFIVVWQSPTRIWNYWKKIHGSTR